MQHRQANESFLLPSVRCRGEAFRMGMGSPPIPLSLSRETVGGCALPRLFGVIIGPAPVMREAAADLSHPVSAHRSWRQLSRDARKGAGCSTPLRMCNGGEPGCRSPPAFRGAGYRGFSPRIPALRRQSRPVPVGYGIGPWIASAAQTESEYPAHPPLQSPGQPFCPIRPCGKARRKEAPRGLLHGRAFHPGANAGGSPRGNREAGPPPFWHAKRGPDVPAPFQHVRVVRWRDPPHTGW